MPGFDFRDQAPFKLKEHLGLAQRVLFFKFHRYNAVATGFGHEKAAGVLGNDQAGRAGQTGPQETDLGVEVDTVDGAAGIGVAAFAPNGSLLFADAGGHYYDLLSAHDWRRYKRVH
ncbi:MAG: hypothetical protein AAF412_06500, partial [Pseudomonadota bacterium]